MNNIFAYAEIDYGNSIEMEDFSIDVDMSKEEIVSFIKNLIEEFNSRLRPGETARKFVKLVGWKPKTRIYEVSSWNDDDELETVQLEEDDIRFERRPDSDISIINFR